jgi:hypothetical protein
MVPVNPTTTPTPARPGLAVVGLNPNTRFIWVYYQHESRIQELCFDPRNGWHAKKDHIVAISAKPNSPIAAIARDYGNETRVYFLDRDNQIIERIRCSSSPDTPSEWKDDPDFPKPTVSPGSQLAAIFSGKGGENIHIFYQDDSHAIQHLKYAEEEWQDASEVPPKARSEERSEESSEESRTESRTESPATLRAQQGSGLAVVSTGDPEDSDLRLYYQLGNDKIQELFTDSKHEWTTGLLPFSIPKNAPISAVIWKAPGVFNIRLYSVSKDNDLLTMTFEKRKWLEQSRPTNAGRITVDNKKPGPVAVAAVWVPYDKTVRVFYPYQPARTGKTYQPARIGETIFLENRALDFTTKPGNADGASQAELTPLIVNIPRGADRSKCQDKQAQESGIWPDEHGLAADSAKQNQDIEKLRDEVKGLKGQIATLQAERLVDGSDVRYWKGQNDSWKRNYDNMSSNYN